MLYEVITPAVKIPGLETRHDLLVDNPAGQKVGETILKAVANLDAHRTLRFGYQQKGPVVLPLLADPPTLGHADRIAFLV